jgi:hypothetical protein
MRGRHLSFLECAPCMKSSWHMLRWSDAPASYSTATKNHELLLMSFPTWLKSTWIPNFLLELSLGSSALLLLLLHLPRCSCRFLSSSFLMLTDFVADFDIISLISSITLSSCSPGWFFCCRLAHCTHSLSKGKSHRLPKTYSSFVALACHSAAVFILPVGSHH